MCGCLSGRSVGDSCCNLGGCWAKPCTELPDTCSGKIIDGICYGYLGMPVCDCVDEWVSVGELWTCVDNAHYCSKGENLPLWFQVGYAPFCSRGGCDSYGGVGSYYIDWLYNECEIGSEDGAYKCANQFSPPDPPPSDYCIYIDHYSSWSECVGGFQTGTEPVWATKESNCVNANSTRPCPACGTADGQISIDQPTTGLCASLSTSTTPILNNSTWEWTCTTVVGSVSCSALASEDGECNSVYNDATWTEIPLEDELCTSGTLSNFTGGTEGPWTWNCEPIGADPTYSTKNCSANCFDFTAHVRPNPFLWPADGSDATVTITLDKVGLCNGNYTCLTQDNTNIPVDGSVDITIPQPNGNFTIPVECTNDNDENDTIKKEVTVTGYCVSRSCNTQGLCQGMSVLSESHDASVCRSSCSSNADCTRGRIIETKP